MGKGWNGKLLAWSILFLLTEEFCFLPCIYHVADISCVLPVTLGIVLVLVEFNLLPPFSRGLKFVMFPLKIKWDPSRIPLFSCYSVSLAICWSDFAVTCDLQAVSGRLQLSTGWLAQFRAGLGLSLLANWTCGKVAVHCKQLKPGHDVKSLLCSSHSFLCLVLKPPGGSWEACVPYAHGWMRAVLYFEVPICSGNSACQV